MQFVRSSLNSSIRWSEITLIDVSNWYSVSVYTNPPAEVLHILFSFWLFQVERLAPVSGWACPRETLACRSCQFPLSAGHLHCADVDAALFISNLGNRHAHPCLINMPPQRLRWILRVCANKPCKHIPLAIGDRDNLKNTLVISNFWHLLQPD